MSNAAHVPLFPGKFVNFFAERLWFGLGVFILFARQ